MTKFVKMSLAAAVAVAGLNTAASAGSLEEAIKGVDISGKVEVGYNYYKTDKATAVGAFLGQDDTTAEETANEFEYDIDIAFKIPVNDMVTANVAFQADHANTVNQGSNTDASANTTGDDQINITKMYFTYANGPVTVMAGKQGMAGAPWFDDDRADGVVGLYNAGFATIAAAHFDNSTASANRTDAATTAALDSYNINAAAVIGAAGPVNYSVWYADVSNLAKSYSIDLSAKFDIFSVEVRHTAIDGGADDVLGEISGGLTKVVATAGLDMATLVAGYATTKDATGNDTYQSVDLTSDTDAATNFALDDLDVATLEDADAWLVGAVVPVDQFTLSAMYVDGEVGSGAATGANLDFDELDLSVSYAMSKNFTASVLYTDASISSDTYDNKSIQTSLKYSF
jgi:hypothetical protein